MVGLALVFVIVAAFAAGMLVQHILADRPAPRDEVRVRKAGIDMLAYESSEAPLVGPHWWVGAIVLALVCALALGVALSHSDALAWLR
jgi:hypothetical protein